MSKITERIETLSHIAIIMVALALTAVLVKDFLIKPSSGEATGPVAVAKSAPAATGHLNTKVSISGIDWKQNHRTLVLGLQVGCHYCAESSEFYKRLVKQYGQSSDLKLVAVFPQPVEISRKYLSSHEVELTDVRQASLDSIDVQGTPTLLLIDNNGMIVKYWRGKLSADKENEVLDSLQTRS